MLSLNLEHVRTFLVVARHLHFGRAAALLNLSQPAVSTHVRRLEQAVGVSLLERNSRSVVLTEDGARFAGRMRDVMEAVDFAITDIRPGRGGEQAPLRVACTPTSATLARQLRVAASRAADLPVVDVQWDVDVTEGVRDGHWSFGVGHALDDDHGELSVTHLRDDPLRLIVSGSGAASEPERLKDLASAELVLPPGDLAPGWHERLRSVLVSSTGQEPTIRDVPVTNAMWLDDVLSHVDAAAPDHVAYTIVPASGVPPRVPSISLKPLAVPLVMLSRPSLVRADARDALRAVADALAGATNVANTRRGP